MVKRRMPKTRNRLASAMCAALALASCSQPSQEAYCEARETLPFLDTSLRNCDGHGDFLHPLADGSYALLNEDQFVIVPSGGVLKFESRVSHDPDGAKISTTLLEPAASASVKLPSDLIEPIRIHQSPDGVVTLTSDTSRYIATISKRRVSFVNVAMSDMDDAVLLKPLVCSQLHAVRRDIEEGVVFVSESGDLFLLAAGESLVVKSERQLKPAEIRHSTQTIEADLSYYTFPEGIGRIFKLGDSRYILESFGPDYIATLAEHESGLELDIEKSPINCERGG